MRSLFTLTSSKLTAHIVNGFNQLVPLNYLSFLCFEQQLMYNYTVYTVWGGEGDWNRIQVSRLATFPSTSHHPAGWFMP